MSYNYPGTKERAVPAATAAREALSAIRAGAERVAGGRVEAEMCVAAYDVEPVGYARKCIQQEDVHKQQHTRRPHDSRAELVYRKHDVQVPVVGCIACHGAAYSRRIHSRRRSHSDSRLRDGIRRRLRKGIHAGARARTPHARLAPAPARSMDLRRDTHLGRRTAHTGARVRARHSHNHKDLLWARFGTP